MLHQVRKLLGKIYNLGKIFMQDMSIDQTEKNNRESDEKQIAFDDPSGDRCPVNELPEQKKRHLAGMEINLKEMFYGDVQQSVAKKCLLNDKSQLHDNEICLKYVANIRGKKLNFGRLPSQADQLCHKF